MERAKYKRATLVNKSGSRAIVTVYFSSDRTNLDNTLDFGYTIDKGDTLDIRIKDGKGIIGTVVILFYEEGKDFTVLTFNAGKREDIKAGKTYDITWVEKTVIVPELKEVEK